MVPDYQTGVYKHQIYYIHSIPTFFQFLDPCFIFCEMALLRLCFTPSPPGDQCSRAQCTCHAAVVCGRDGMGVTRPGTVVWRRLPGSDRRGTAVWSGRRRLQGHRLAQCRERSVRYFVSYFGIFLKFFSSKFHAES